MRSRKKTKVLEGKNVEDEPQEPVAAGRWLPVEEELLATCYVAVSEDNSVGRILSDKQMAYVECANCQRVQRRVQTGQTFGGKVAKTVWINLKRAQSIYRDYIEGRDFQEDTCGRFLRFHPKWVRTEQVDLTEDVPGASSEDLFRH
ncbi:hypothetical protein Tco_0183237 [Tanacetum coccineum]